MRGVGGQLSESDEPDGDEPEDPDDPGDGPPGGGPPGGGPPGGAPPCVKLLAGVSRRLRRKQLRRACAFLMATRLRILRTGLRQRRRRSERKPPQPPRRSNLRGRGAGLGRRVLSGHRETTRTAKLNRPRRDNRRARPGRSYGTTRWLRVGDRKCSVVSKGPSRMQTVTDRVVRYCPGSGPIRRRRKAEMVAAKTSKLPRSLNLT